MKLRMMVAVPHAQSCKEPTPTTVWHSLSPGVYLLIYLTISAIDPFCDGIGRLLEFWAQSLVDDIMGLSPHMKASILRINFVLTVLPVYCYHH